MNFFAPFCLFLLFMVSCGTNSSNPPSKEFTRFCSEVISKEWRTDTSRLMSKNLYGELRNKSMHRINGQPFYAISLEGTRVKHYFTSRGQTEGYEAFEEVKSIWGYFYYKQSSDGMFPDGVIEEWHFGTNEEADKVLEQLHEIGTEVFFNTQPYFCVVKNKLYVFHTRAMAFSYDQKPIFEEFVKRNKANI